MEAKAICVWGDSLAKGIYYDDTRKRYAILKDHCLRLLEKEIHVPVQNCSAMGRTAPECLAEISESERVPGGVAVFEFGG